jgi:hypothetical protein
MRPERSAGPGPAQARYRWLFSVGHTQELPGSWRIHPVPLPRSRIPASSSDLTVSAQQCRPHFADSEGTDFTDLSRLNHAASVPAAYASSGALPHPHARLASGRWLALAGRDSNPLDSIEKFPSSTSDFLLSQVYPGATAKSPANSRAQTCAKSSVARTSSWVTRLKGAAARVKAAAMRAEWYSAS